MLSTCLQNKHGSSQVIKNIQKHAVIMEPLLDSCVSLFQGYFFSHPFSRVLFQPPMGSHSLWLPCFKGTLFQGIWLFSISLFQGYVLLPSFKGFPLPRGCVVIQVAVLFSLASSASCFRKASTASAKVAHGPTAKPWLLNHMWSSHAVLIG